MGKVGACVVIYGSRGAAIADTLLMSKNHDVGLYIVDRNNNPFNRSLVRDAKRYVVIPELTIDEIAGFVGENRKYIDFVMPGSEDPIINGLGNKIAELYPEIGVLCPTKEYAIESSKVKQRKLIDRICPEANPKYKVFEYRSGHDPRKEFENWFDDLDEEVAIKPDKPGFGKGVGVSGDHFNTIDDAWEHFRSIYEEGDSVIVEEKLDGEEFSLQYFSDGINVVSTPAVRDYKRRFDGDKGENTGGMGSYMDNKLWLPFMTYMDYKSADSISRLIFKELKRGAKPSDLKGMPIYMAFICTKDGVKVLEINSRPGDPEIMNVLPVIQKDFVDLCLGMKDGNLPSLTLESLASVVTYGVPPTYGGGPEKESSKGIDLAEAYEYVRFHPNEVFIYPGSVEQADDETHMLNSRTVASVAVGFNIADAREKSRHALSLVKGVLEKREDVGADYYIEANKKHMQRLRR